MNDTEEPVGIDDGLTSQQRAGVDYVARGWANVDIADALNVRPETVGRWQKLPAFRRALAAVVAQHHAETVGYLRELTLKSLATIEDMLLMSDPQVRLRAALGLLSLSGVGRIAAKLESQSTDSAAEQ